MLAINRPIAILMAALALSIFGWQSLRHLETSLLPEIEYPEFVIITEFEGGSPEEIERAITIHIEEVLSSLPSLKDIVSSSRDGLSVITAQFHWDIDTRFTLLRIREKIDAVLDRFPKGTKRPYILDFNPGSLPIMELALWGESDLTILGDFAVDVLKPRFSQIEGVAGATVIGSPQNAVKIVMDPIRCAALGITADNIIKSVQQNLPTQPISSMVRVGYAEYPMTVEFPLNTPEDMNFIPIENPDKIPVRLNDVATIDSSPISHHSLSYQDTTKSLLIQLYKESGASTVSATQSALKLVDELKATYPDMHLTVIKNRGVFIQKAIAGLKQAILLGAGLAFVIIMLFLQDFRYSLILSVVIPVSLLFAFNALYLHNISLNIMTLGGLALGLGLIVDNGIVVVESVFTEFKKERSSSSMYFGVKKVSRAITGATLTTIAIFLPIIYVKGYAAVLFKQQALTITYTLIISLLAAIFLIPAAYRFFIMRRKNDHIKSDIKQIGSNHISLFRPFYSLFQKGYEAAEHFYHKTLLQALNHKKWAVGLLLMLFIIAGFFFTIIPKQYWPAVKSNQVEIKVAVPTTVPFEIVKKKTEQSIQNLLQMSEVIQLTTRLADPFDIAAESYHDIISAPGNYHIYFSVTLDYTIKPEDLNRVTFLQQITLPKDNLSIYLPTKLSQEIIGQSDKNFKVYISGESTKLQQETAEDLADYLTSFDLYEEINIETGGKQIIKSIDIDPQVMTLYNFSPDRVADNLYLQTGKKEIGIWHSKLHKIPVIAMWDSSGVKDLNRVLGAIHEPGKSLFRNEQLISIQDITKVQEIKRVNRKQVTTVQAHVAPHKLGDAAQLVNEWNRSHYRSGITVSIAGESERIAKSFKNLFMAFVMAVILVYLILAAQFESFIHPLNIILTVPMGLVGAILGLIIFQQSLNVISLIGMVMLIGIGVNDAIIKVDYMNYLTRRKKMSVREAILQTSAEKFRPVMMTTLTTIVVMLPMALGVGGASEMNQPLAITIIGGLSISTALTLIITPVMYEIAEKFKAGKLISTKNY